MRVLVICALAVLSGCAAASLSDKRYQIYPTINDPEAWYASVRLGRKVLAQPEWRSADGYGVTRWGMTPEEVRASVSCEGATTTPMGFSCTDSVAGLPALIGYQFVSGRLAAVLMSLQYQSDIHSAHSRMVELLRAKYGPASDALDSDAESKAEANRKVALNGVAGSLGGLRGGATAAQLRGMRIDADDDRILASAQASMADHYVASSIWTVGSEEVRLVSNSILNQVLVSYVSTELQSLLAAKLRQLREAQIAAGSEKL